MRWRPSGQRNRLSAQADRSPDAGAPETSPGRPVPDGAAARYGPASLLPVARVVMEYCWLAPWLGVVGAAFYGPGQALLPGVWVLLLLLGGDVAARAVTGRMLILVRARTTLVALGLAIGLLAVHQQYYAEVPLWALGWLWRLLIATHAVLPDVPQAVAGAAAAACLWWRGLVLGMRAVDAVALEEAYRTGVAMVVLYVVAALLYGDTRAFAATGGALPASFLAFFAVGLAALALARLWTIWARGLDAAAASSRRDWPLLVLGVVGMVVGTASAVAGVITVDLQRALRLVVTPLLPLVEGLFVVLFLVASVVARLVLLVLARLPWRQVAPGDVPSTALGDLLRRLRDLEVHPHVVEGARWSLTTVLVAALVLGMAVTVVLGRRRPQPSDADEHESVWSTREALTRLAGVLTRRRSATRERDELAGGGAGTIRRIYRDVLAWGASLGAPRPAWATPREYAPRLGGRCPQAGSEIEALTWAYERVRYGRWRPAPGDVQAALTAWRRVRMLGGAPRAARDPGRVSGRDDRCTG
ncbi:MAG: DUF4129 domain-containing protein [Armatimonadota bacterium]|nr:DUF4129 domain-containing protein [Armatimonadota bacterium]